MELYPGYFYVALVIEKLVTIYKIETIRIIKLSNLQNELLLEKFYEEFLEEGFSETLSEKLARNKLESE